MNYLKNIFKIKSTIILMLISFFCLILSAMRIAIAENHFLLFLIWNLFLAFIPWFISSILYLQKNFNKALFIILSIIWLAFFPNSLYIVTDIIHIKTSAPTMRWFDLILLFSYSFAGFFYGFVSLDFFESKIKTMFKIKYPQLISVIVIYLSAFGIYLGRFLRWNSWDLITNLSEIMKDLFLPITNPFLYARTWGFVFLIGTLFNIMYLSYKAFKRD